jgi:DNA uptake protein ComE-like DNA-binding protein
LLAGVALVAGVRYAWRAHEQQQAGENVAFLATGGDTKQGKTWENKPHYPKKEAKPIDINTADTTLWRSLPGIGPVLSRRIVKFRDAVGGFQEPEDLLRVYGLPEETFEELRPFLQIVKETRPAKRNTPPPPKWVATEPVDINTADTALLNTLPGIGTVLAERIVKFRTAKKGFEQVSELKAVYGLSPETYAKLEPRLYVEQETFAALRHAARPAQPSAFPAENQRLMASRGIEEETPAASAAASAAPLNLNTATEAELQTVPGLNPTFASRIVKLRTNMGFWADVNMLTFLYGIKPEAVALAAPHLTASPPAGAAKKNLNMLEIKDLKRYVFLTEAQAESLVAQRKKLGVIHTWDQLTGMDTFTLRRLKAYFAL